MEAAFCTSGKCISQLWCVCDLQHSMGFEAACKETVLPLGWLMCTRNTSRTRVFLRPMSVSPLRSSMSELRSFRMPAQSILQQRQNKMSHFKWRYTEKIRSVVYCNIGRFLQVGAKAEILMFVFVGSLSSLLEKKNPGLWLLTWMCSNKIIDVSVFSIYNQSQISSRVYFCTLFSIICLS